MCSSTRLIGVITKVDAPNANVPMVRQWLEAAGCSPIFEVDSKTGRGIAELKAFLEEPNPEPITLEQAIELQRQGKPDW